MASFLEDPRIEVRSRVAEINRVQFDEQETAEREKAAQAYGREDEAHFVSFLDDCVKTSVEAMAKIRLNQQECWDVFNEEEPPSYRLKESWQSRVVVPKPYSSCQFAQAVVRKAFDAEFLSIENEQDDEAAHFWQKLMSLMLSRTYSNFPINFTDATGMSFAVGQSMEMIPTYRPGKGLRYILTEPWKIHRDPDSISRQPQSGMYWVHQEYLDYYLLKDGEKNGLYQNVPDMGPGGSYGNSKSNPNLTKEEIARRREMMWNRSRYRAMALTSEFWGTVLDKRGELLLPNATFTVTGDKVIRLPKVSPYPTLRWPGVGFSALPHLLRFDGRALIQGIKSLWYFMNNLFCLHADNLNWIVNPTWELDVSALVDQADVDLYPGKGYLTRGTVSGQQAYRVGERRSQTGDILANMNFADQRFQEGVMMNKETMGLPGYRAEVTKGEAVQNLEQSMTVVGLIGRNLEDGALNAIQAGAETVVINITYAELAMLMGREVADKYVDRESPTGLRLPQLNSGSFKVSGISALMKDMEIIRGIRDVMLPMFKGEFGNIFAPYFKPYQLIRSVEKRLNLRDEGIVVDETTAKRVDQAQQVQQEAAIQTQQAAAAAAAALAEMKTVAEEAKAEMNRAKAEEHRGKGILAQAKAVEVMSPEPEPQGSAQ
ncbi:MAG: hypothetical protein QME78_00025 [Thermodesulfobacteriota bacterium]|nr:hypothetical protein [Thermodesulfobacteriota bacterium]